ncbi:hypothetical protein [Ruegeria atlantica]|uniref:hypothetical protein n=1 Tax=Ruegeria atlantica TaxID=81569 RepID=UPI00147DB99B|nr:hypothetical protein [Ruegeria atlantica]
MTTTTVKKDIGHPNLGLGIALLAVFMFATADTLVERYPVLVVVALRYVASFVLLLVVVFPRIGTKIWRTDRIGLVFTTRYGGDRYLTDHGARANTNSRR